MGTGERTRGVIALADGTEVPVRAAFPGDAAALQRLHERLSERSVELRFFSPQRRLSDEMVERLARPEDAQHFALAALSPDARREGGEEIVGVVRYEREATTEAAEYAAVVEDDWQGRGLGAAMTERLVGVARERGIRRLYALVTPGNEGMLRLLRGFGLPTRTAHKGGAECVEVDLSPEIEARVAQPGTATRDGM
jgi:RimJ/RimL family protein N-acetyltransferase